MSITVPTNLNTNIANRSENWIVQLFNSSKTDSVTTTDEQLDTNETQLDVNNGAVFNVNDVISIGSGTELMKITAINEDGLTLQRRFMGTAASSNIASGTDIHKRNYVGLSYSSITFQDQFFEPCILNKASIRESIDLDNQTSARSNVSLKIANFTYQGAPFSEQLHNGSNVYLNQLVRIYIPPAKMSSSIDIEDCLQIYEGRLVNTAHDDTSITLEINTDEPWKDVSVPNVKHNNKDFYQPIVYGSYNAASEGGDGSYGAVFPVEIMMAGNGLITTVMPKSYSSGAHLHHYGGFNWFVAFGEVGVNGSFSTTTTDENVIVLKTPANHRAQGYIRLEDSTHDAGGSVTYMDNSERAFTYNRSTGAYDDSVYASKAVNSGSTAVYLVAQTPTKKFTSWFSHLSLRYNVQGAVNPQDYYIQAFSNVYDNLTDNLFTSSGVEKTLAANTSSHSFTFNDSPGNAAQYDAGEDGDLDTQDGPIPPDDVLIKFDASASELGGHSNHTLRVLDVKLKLNTIFKGSEDDYRQIINHKFFFCGADGLHDTQVGGVYWIGGSGSSTNITSLPQMHRDLLHRFTYIENTPESWSDLISEHNWNGRLWQHTPTDLSSILKKLQSEGQFIFRLKNDNTPQYVFLRNNPIADHILTKQDISSLQVSDTDFRSISTKYILNFRKHPAESGKYIEQTIVTDSTARDLYNIQNTSDNTKTVDFDYLINSISAGSDINSSYHNYRKQLFGSVKTILKCKVVNPEFYSMDVGDIVALEDMHIKAYNVNYSNTAYMITSIQRKLGEMDIELREVADSLATTWGPIVVTTGGEGVIHNVQNNFTMVNNHWKCKTMSIELINDLLGFNQVISSSTAIDFSTSTQQFNYTPNISIAHDKYQIRCRCNETGEVAESSIFSIALS